MISYLKRLTIRNIVSPFGLAVLSYLVFLFAWIFPPGLYTQYIHEPDLMFLEPITLVFFTVCVLAFLFGVRASDVFRSPGQTGYAPAVSVGNPLVYLLPPLLVVSGLGAMYLARIGVKINFISLLASQDGAAVKLAGSAGQLSEGRWDESLPLLTVVLWWSLYRATQLRLQGYAKALFSIVFLGCLLLGMCIGVATVNRTSLMPIVLGTMVVYLFPKTRKTNIKLAKLAFTSFFCAAGSVAAFLSLSFLRGTFGLQLLVSGLLGYTIVSYNRLAAVLTGVMHYAFEGRGVYLAPLLVGDVKTDYLFHFADRFGWPTALTLWQTEFSSTSAAGLNAMFIWSGAFGYVYSDIGWWTPLYWCLVGVLAGWSWAKMCAGRTVGVVLYPWVAFSIMMWCGANFVFRTNFVQYCEFALLLHVYDRLSLRVTRQTEAVTIKPEADAFFGPVTHSLDRGIF